MTITVGRLNREEAIGLAVASAAHVALMALLVLQPPSAVPVLPLERIAVTISEEVGLISTSPQPASDARPDEAPEIGEPAPPEPAPPEPAPPRPEPVRREPPPPPPKVEPRPQPRPQPKAEPRPAPTPAPRPSPTASPRPSPTPSPRAMASPAPRPSPSPAPRAAATPAPKAATTSRPAASSDAARAAQASPRPAPVRAGGSRIGEDFLSGVPGAQATGTSQTPPAAAVGPVVRSAISQAINRQLKPHWVVPQGPETELLVTRVRFRLARDGSLVGEPEVLDTTGVTDANRNQIQRHREQALRAIRLAAPFDLPDEFYSAWQVVTSNFERGLAQ